MVTELLTAKLVAMGVLFVISLFLGLIPMKLSQWFKWNKDTHSNAYVKFLLCTGGGVLLCTTFLHLLPEVREGVEENNFPNWGFHWAEFLCCLGFFLMYIIEESVHFVFMKDQFHLKQDVSKNLEYVEENVTTEKCHSHSHQDPEVVGRALATLRGFFTILALSIHSVFEGLAVGLEKSPSSVWYMFAAIASHKFVLSFCVGIKLITSNLKKTLIVIYIMVFSIISSLGIGIGLGFSEDTMSETKVPAVALQGLAAGTLLYVIFFEILTDERRVGTKEMIGVVSGFFIMMTIMTFLHS